MKITDQRQYEILGKKYIMMIADEEQDACSLCAFYDDPGGCQKGIDNCTSYCKGYFAEVTPEQKKEIAQVNTPTDKAQKHLQGRKYDAGKPMYNLVPADALEEVVMVLTKGAIKYNEPIDQENWRLVDNPQSRYFSAAQRHLWADQRGDFIDDGEGGTDCYHLACAISSLLFKLQLRIEEERENNAKQAKQAKQEN
jgi:hypothetical protein